MGLIQIEESELATLRQERNTARTKVDELQNSNRELTTKVETAEAQVKTVEGERDTAKQKVTELEETASKGALKDKRMQTLGAGFLAKLGDTSKTVLTELAGKASDDEWELALKEREEMASKLANATIKRDMAADSTTPPSGGGAPSNADGTSFESEEVASFLNRNGTGNGATPAAQNADTSVRQLARTFTKRRTPATT